MRYLILAGVLLKVQGNARAQGKNSLLKCQVATALNVIVKVNSDGIHCHRMSKYNLGFIKYLHTKKAWMSRLYVVKYAFAKDR